MYLFGHLIFWSSRNVRSLNELVRLFCASRKKKFKRDLDCIIFNPDLLGHKKLPTNLALLATTNLKGAPGSMN